MITVITNDDAKEFRGLSTDQKPLGVDEEQHPSVTTTTYINYPYRIANGSMFFEMDLSEVYMYAVYTDVKGPTGKNTAKWIRI